MEQQLYQTALLVSGIACLVMALTLLRFFGYYGIYPNYRRLRLLVSVVLAIIGAGCLLHWHFGFLPAWPFTILMLAGLGVLIAIFYNIHEYGIRLDKQAKNPHTDL